MVELLTRNTQASKYRCMCFSELLRLLTASIFNYPVYPLARFNYRLSEQLNSRVLEQKTADSPLCTSA